MKIILIILAAVVIIAFVVKVLTNASDMEREHERMLEEEKSRQKLKEAIEQHERQLAELQQSGQPTNPIEAATKIAQTAAEVAEKAKAEAERKRKEAAATEAAKRADTQMALGFEAPVTEHKPADPDKPKRKSPVEHSVVHHDDNFWLQVCREYQTLKHKNPKLTRTDFVRIKNDPTIKATTFDEKMRQLATTGMFVHKPRKSNK